MYTHIHSCVIICHLESIDGVKEIFQSICFAINGQACTRLGQLVVVDKQGQDATGTDAYSSIYRDISTYVTCGVLGSDVS